MRTVLNKKILSAILAGIIIMIGLTGCNSENTKAIFKEAQEKNIALDSMDMSLNMVMDLSMDHEETVIIRSKTNSKFSGLLEKNDILMQMETVYTYDSGESGDTSDLSMSYYYADGFYYMDTMGQKSKYEMSVDEIIKQIVSSVQIDSLQADMLDDIKMEKNGEGRILNFTLKPEISDGITGSVENQLKTLLSNTDADIKIESGSGTVKINETGYIEEQSLKMVCKASVDEQEITLNVDMDILINNPGQQVSVEKPVDADYTEIH